MTKNAPSQGYPRQQGTLFAVAPQKESALTILTPEFKRVLTGGVDRLENAQATIVARTGANPGVTIGVESLEITFSISPKIDCEALSIYGVRCEDLPRMAICTASRTIGGVLFQATGWSRFLQAESYNPPITPRPPADMWRAMPGIQHLRAILPFADACQCDSNGSFTAAGAYSAATARPFTRTPHGNYYRINISARALYAALRAGSYSKCCVFDNRLHLSGNGVYASIGHIPELSGLDPEPLIEFCELYPIKTRLSFDENIDVFPFPEHRGALRFRGFEGAGAVESDYGTVDFSISAGTPAFDFIIADIEGLRPLLLNRSVDVYIPQQQNHPVGFRMSGAWFWSVTLP